MGWNPFRRVDPAESDDAPEVDDLERVRAFHQITKHDFHGFARGPGELAWETQPDPYRRYAGARELPLVHPRRAPEPTFDAAMNEGGVAPAAATLESVSQLFRDAFGVTAHKAAGASRWSLRANPSSGNLHPTEATFVGPAVEGLVDAPCVAHYAPAAHLLEERARLPEELWRRLAADLPPVGFFVGLSSIPWREAWKYGERAFRYCQHDVGHAIATTAIAAAGLGWSVRPVRGPSSAELARVLGLAGSAGPEREWADVLLAVAPPGLDAVDFEPGLAAELEALPWSGLSNTLSPDHVEWELVEAAALATQKPRTENSETWADPFPAWDRPERGVPLRALVHGRRSAVDMDGAVHLSADAFLDILRATLPRAGRVPFGALPGRPRIDLALFVHRVDGLERGIYVLVRDPARREPLRAALRAEFAWEPVACAEDLPLFRLHAGDVRGMAARVSCDQPLAGSGVFSLGMLAEYDATLASLGPWSYPHLYWEAGAVGQVLYLEAEAAGIAGTGIGCYFDDPVHALLGLRGSAYQSLYHFAVGGRVEDPRIQTLAAYEGIDEGALP